MNARGVDENSRRRRVGLISQAEADQALELGAGVFDVLPLQGKVQGQAEVARSCGLAGAGHEGEDLLVGGMAGDHRCRWRRGCRIGLAGQDEQGLAGDPQMIEVQVEVPQAGGQLLNPSLDLFDLAGQRLLAGVDPVQQPRAGIRRAHVVRQAGVEGPANRRLITSVIAQYTRDSELAGSCS